MRGAPAAFTLTLCLIAASAVLCQNRPDTLETYLHFEDTPPLNCLFTYFPSFFIQNGIEMKDFVRSHTFRDLRRKYGDKKAADAMYIRAMQLTQNNTAIALWCAMIASFDHKMVGLKNPIFSLFFPLTGESDAEFSRRVSHLPAKLYDDSPQTPAGDRDKLQHFFGSAFLIQVFESREAAMRFGEFVEKGEDAFIVDGINDDRDLRADVQGQQFGLALMENNRRLPSEFFKSDLASGQQALDVDPPANCCMGPW
jgi:hypothetical protein